MLQKYLDRVEEFPVKGDVYKVLKYLQIKHCGYDIDNYIIEKVNITKKDIEDAIDFVYSIYPIVNCSNHPECELYRGKYNCSNCESLYNIERSIKYTQKILELISTSDIDLSIGVDETSDFGHLGIIVKGWKSNHSV